jgi:adenylate cyclase
MRLSIRVKWTLTVVLLAALPLLFLTVRGLGLFRAGFETSEKNLEAAVVRQVAQGVDSELGRASDVAARVGRILGDADIPQETRLALVQDLVASEPRVERIAVYGADRKLIDEVKQGKGKGELTSPPELPAQPDERSGFLPVTFLGDQPEVRFVAPVGKGGEVHGWVLARLAPGALDDVVRTVGESVFEDHTATPLVVLDLEGRRIAGRGDVERARAFVRAVGGATAPGILVARSRLPLGGDTVNGSVLPLAGRPWQIVLVRPQREAFPELETGTRELRIAFAAILVLALVVGVWLATRTTRPILQLVQLTRKYAARAFSERSPVRTGDELETLGDALGTMADSLAAGEAEIARRAQVEAGLSRYLPEEVAKAVAEGRGKLELGGERKDVAVVFADVVAFTSFSENAPPEQVVAFLNELFGLLSEIVFRHGGIVDKFMGDCIMAVFGATKAIADEGSRSPAERAVACAEDMHRFVDTIHAEWQKKFGFDVRLGVGVAAGPAVVGNLGSEKRMEFTAIGDAVNLASRLETLARPGQTLVTEQVEGACRDAFEFQSLGAQPIRGKADKVEIFELTP